MQARTKPDLPVIQSNFSPRAVSVLHGPVIATRSVKPPELEEHKSEVEQLATL